MLFAVIVVSYPSTLDTFHWSTERHQVCENGLITVATNLQCINQPQSVSSSPKVLISGEAILNAKSSNNPLGCMGFAPSPAVGSLTMLHRPGPLAVGIAVLVPHQASHVPSLHGTLCPQ